MPVVQRKGGLSSQGFGQILGAGAAASYIENVFNSTVYTGTGSSQIVYNNVPLAATAAWNNYVFQKNGLFPVQIRADNSGNIYFTGYTFNNVGVVVKLNSLGGITWQKQIVDTGIATDCIVRNLAVDSSGNVIVVGYGSLAPFYSFIIKYDSNGTLQWQRQLVETSGAAYGVITDSADAVYIGGVDSSGSNQYGYVAKYNSSGTLQWQRKLSDTSVGGFAYVQSLTKDSSNNIYAVGYGYNGSIYYSTIVKYNSSGTIQWQRRYTISSAANAGANDVAVDASNVYVVGTTGLNGYVLKYNSSGALQWQRFFDSSVNFFSVSIDATSNLYIAGSKTTNINQTTQVVKYNSSGVLQFQRNLQMGYAMTPAGIATSSDGNLYVQSANYSTSGYDSRSVITKLKQDGTTTGGIAYVSMAPDVLTDSAGTATDSAGTLVDAAGTATSSTPAFSSSDASVSRSAYTQDAIGTAGGLVWLKCQTDPFNHNLFDTSTGATKLLHTNNTTGTATDTASLTAFNAAGFALGTGNTAGNEVNSFGANFVAWTFKEKPRFFDIVTYTGTGVARTISHNLNATPGCIIVKRTDTTGNWQVYHSGLTSAAYAIQLNLSNPQALDTTIWNSTAPTGSNFSVGTNADVNASGGTYVAYLFASNAGGFGLSGAENVITCGTYTGNASANGPTINLGYEPQWVMVKNITTSSIDWVVEDTLRGMSLNSSNYLNPNLLNVEASINPAITPTSTGFKIATSNLLVNAATQHIYVAIRRGPMATPINSYFTFTPTGRYGTGTAGTANQFGFVTDLVISKNYSGGVSQNWAWTDRLRGESYELESDNAGAENYTANDITTFSSAYGFKFGTGSAGNMNTSGESYIDYSFKRAPGFLDIVAYTGNGSSSNQITHNLGVTPELIICKTRSQIGSWPTFYNMGATTFSDGEINNVGVTLSTAYGGGQLLAAAPTATTFTLGNKPSVNASGTTYISYLFASLPGSVKIGTYSGTGATQTIDCGFSNGTNWVLIKRIDGGTGNWYIWDRARGMFAGNDNYLLWNSNGAQVNANNVYSVSNGFQIVSTSVDINGSGAGRLYLYMAIA